MKITTFSDYSLRILIYLAVHEETKSTATQIAKDYDISFHHIAKAAQWLAREGYVRSARGRSGGMELCYPPENINIGQLLKKAEADTAMVDCMRSDGGQCCISPSCGLKFALFEAQTAFYAALDKYSLADISNKKTALTALLGEAS